MITISISVKDGNHLRGDVLELEELGPTEMAQVDNLVHELKDTLERIARVREARRTKETDK